LCYKYLILNDLMNLFIKIFYVIFYFLLIHIYLRNLLVCGRNIEFQNDCKAGIGIYFIIIIIYSFFKYFILLSRIEMLEV
jgi:hypothetical protein